MDESRVPTGIDGLDNLIEGGIPRGSLVLLAGNPGTGKTVFGIQFLFKGAKDCDENGIYVSFAESEETIMYNMSKLFGRDLKNEVNGKVKILDFTTVTEKGLGTLLEIILEKVTELKATRLVIDSFSAMAQAFKEPMEARSVLHNILGKLVRNLGCTTILIVEVPIGVEKIGISVEEFVADGVIILRKGNYNSRLFREIEIEKLRGTKLERRNFLFTLDKSFHVFPPFSLKEPENPKLFEADRGTKTHYPSGIPELNEILGGQGYPRGCSVLFELGENVPTGALDAIINPTISNFIMRNRGFISVPTIGYGPEDIRKMISSFTGEERFDKFVRVLTFPNPLCDMNKPYIVPWKDPALEEQDAISNFNRYMESAFELASTTGKNTLHLLSGDNLVFLAEKFNSSVVGRSVIANRLGKDLMIYIAQPSIPDLTKVFADTLTMHFKIEEKNGSMILYGKKPKTILYVIEPDASRGCRVKLTPVI